MSSLVSDPFGAATDEALPTVTLALDPSQVARGFKRLPFVAGNRKLKVKAIRVTRHKPGRRCVIEYRVKTFPRAGEPIKYTIIGKIRARRFGKESYRLLRQFWDAGFDELSMDRISVPEPLGFVPRLRMWCQRKVPGKTAETLLAGPYGTRIACHVAEAIRKVHLAGIPTKRTHDIADELRILAECLPRVIQLNPEWNQRIARLLAACEQLARSLARPRACGIHRDFYPAQVIVHKTRLYLIDFDLYCIGDPGLDIGNFQAHMTESSLRELGNPQALHEQEQALEDTFVSLAGERCRPAITAYKTLSLVRHIYLSTQFPERQRFTETLLEICEQRLGLAAQIRR